MSNNHLPSVSMLIAAYNEEAIIGKKMKDCLAFDYLKDKLEILVGSDGSDDRTNEIIQQYGRSNIRLIPFSTRRGKAAVLNDLAKVARGDILVFSDANTMYKPDALCRLVRHFADVQIGGVCGRLILLDGNGQKEAHAERFYWDYENYLKYLEGKIRTVFGANGAIYAIRRELFKALPCEKVVMDDFLIPLSIVQAGFDVVYDKDAIAWEFAAPDVKSEFKRKVRIGAANFHGIQEILPLLSPTRGFVAFGLWSHKIIRWFVPFLLIALLVSNSLLVSYTVYNITFGIQVGYYVLVLLTWILSQVHIRISYLTYLYYFFVTNLALFIGFFRFLAKAQKPAWTRVGR